MKRFALLTALILLMSGIAGHPTPRAAAKAEASGGGARAHAGSLRMLGFQADDQPQILEPSLDAGDEGGVSVEGSDGPQTAIQTAATLKREPVILYRDPNPPATLRVPPPRVFSVSSVQSAEIQIHYLPAGEAVDSYTCYAWPNNAKAAFNYAAGIWESLLNSNVPIEIDACWTEMSGNALGGSYSNYVVDSSTSTAYQESLANSILETNTDTNNPDMRIVYNRLFDWYYGTDGNTTDNTIDFASVVLHEIAHGLGFGGSMTVSGDNGYWGWGSSDSYHAIYDEPVETGSGASLFDLGYGSTALGSALTGGNLYFDGLEARSANGGARPKLYAPSTWAPGSSYSHLDYDTFNDTVNELMVWQISDGESIHSPGPVALGLLEDLGWAITPTSPPPLVTSITPNHAPNDGIVSISDLSGSDFVNPTVALIRVGEKDIPAANITVVNSSTLTCDFDLSGATAGIWDVVVTNEDEQFDALADGFTVTDVPASNVGIDKRVIGSDFAPGDALTFTLSISNSGTLTATGVVVTDVLPSEVIHPSFDSTLDITQTGGVSYTWSVEPLNPGESGSIILYGQIDPELENVSAFANEATIWDPEDNTAGNNTSRVTVTLEGREVFLPLVIRNWPPEQTVKLYPDQDASVLQGKPSGNFGGVSALRTGYDLGGCSDSVDGEISRSLISFDLSRIPAGSVKEATLYLRMVSSCYYEGHSQPRTVTVYRVNAGWSEDLVTWNNRPGYAEMYDTASVSVTEGRWYSLDVTDLVNRWLNGTYPNRGIMVRAPETSGVDFVRLEFAAREWSGSPYYPYLEVTYHGAPAYHTESTSFPMASGFSFGEVLGFDGKPLDHESINQNIAEWSVCTVDER